MIKDYHMHPNILKKPEQFDDFVRVAIENDIEQICVTDHMPLIDSLAEDRIPCGMVKQYCYNVRELAEKYKDKISIKLGIEIDYHPSFQKQIEDTLRAGEFDYVLASSHLFVVKDIFKILTTRNEYANAMFENTISAAKSGYFSAIAHIDMYHWVFENPNRFALYDDGFDEKKHAEIIEKSLYAIKENDLFLEINPHFSVAKEDINYVYPSVNITKKALDMGVKFSYGSDAHKASHVGIMLDKLRQHSVYGKAVEF